MDGPLYAGRPWHDALPVSLAADVRALYLTAGATRRTRIGLVLGHLTSEGEVCAGVVYWDGEGVDAPPESVPRWTLVSDSPLTLAEQVACNTCGLRGFIRDGRWVAA